jgi:hypothetical protein
MVDGLDTVLWVAGIAFLLSLFFRLWWVAALITAGVVAMFSQSQRFDFMLIGALVTGIPAFVGTALGKHLHKRRSDPFDPADMSRRQRD